MRTIAHISDLHFGREEPDLAHALIAALREQQPDLIVVSGDFTQRGRRRQFAAARAFLDRLPSPVLAVPGNHDVPLYDVARRFLLPLARYRRYICAEVEPLLIDDEIAVMGINTARSATFVNGRISYLQADAIRSVFSKIPPDRFKIVAAHHPLIPPPDAPNLPIVGRARMAADAISEAGVDLVLTGHFHRAFSGDLAAHHLAIRRSTVVIEAGTAVSSRRRAEPNSYNLLQIEPGRLSCTLWFGRGNCFEIAETVKYVRDGERWTRR
jgi:3',5'-cyclic AMP phosphodiesterase CpdA